MQGLIDTIQVLLRWIFCCCSNLLSHFNKCILLSNYFCSWRYHNIVVTWNNVVESIRVIRHSFEIIETGLKSLFKTRTSQSRPSIFSVHCYHIVSYLATYLLLFYRPFQFEWRQSFTGSRKKAWVLRNIPR